MRKGFSRLVFSLFLFFVGTFFSLAAEASAPAVPVPAKDSVAAPAEKIFYKLALNETFFIRQREAIVNAGVSVEILQGNPEKISLEICGAGEVVGVSGDYVLDWSVRRQGARSFLEIRTKDLKGQKKFKLIVMGKQALKLPTTISPLIFSGVDSAAFTGIVRFLSSVDFRLYAKQERGLIPLGARSRNEINYMIQGAEPSLRLDIANANDLLEAVSLDGFSLVGDIGADGARFRMKGKAHVREIGAEVVVLSGDAALYDFPAENNFVVLAKTNAGTGQPTYSLRFPARGDFDVELNFDAEIKSVDGWRHLNFEIPLAQVAPFSLKGMPEDTVFSADNISLPQRGGNGEFSGFLPAGGKLDLRWRPSIPTPPEFSAGIYSVDAVTEMQLSTGVLKQCSELDFTISQGEISSLLFEMSGDGEILDVRGQDLISWTQISQGDGKRGLLVRLSQPKSGKYRLRVDSQTRTTALPKTLYPIRLVPSDAEWEGLALSAICVRNNEILRLRGGLGVRCEALPQTGMTQVVASAYPSDRDFFGKKTLADDEVSVYRLSSGTDKLSVRADFVRSELIVKPRVRWIFSDGKITSAQAISFDVRNAPLYEMRVLVPANQELVVVNSALVAGHELSENPDTPGYRLLNLVFSEPVLGSGKVSLTLQQAGGNVGEDAILRPCLFPQAHFVFGETGLSCPKNIRLLPGKTENLIEVAAEEYSEENPPQLAFRMRNGEWRLSVRPEARETSLSGESVCVYKIGEEKIFGNFSAKYATGGVPVGSVRLAFPSGAKVLSLSGDGVREWSADESGVAVVALSEETSKDFSVSATFEEPRATSGMQPFEGVRLLDVLGERGSILITADRVLALSGEESVRSLAALPLQSVREDFAKIGGAILFRAYQFVERPFRLMLETHLPAAESSPDLVISEARISANADESCDVVYRYRSLGATEMKIAVPAGMKIAFEGARTLSDGLTVIPLAENATEIAFRMERVDRDAVSGKPVSELPFPRVFAPVMRTVFVGFGDAKSETLDVVVSGRRQNDVFDASLVQRFLSVFWAGRGVSIPAFFVLAGALIVSGFLKKGKFHRACLAVAVAAGSVLSISVAWWLVETVRPEYGDAVLVAGLTEPGAQLSVTLRRFYFTGADSGKSFPSAFLIAAFFAGNFLLLLGTVFGRRRLRVRVIGRVLLYVAGAIFAAEDFPYRVPAFAAMAIAVETSAWVAGFLARAKSAGARPGTSLGGTSVALAFALLVPAVFPQQSRAADVPAASVPAETSAGSVYAANSTEIETPHDVADRVTQSIDVRGDRIVARGDIRVTGYAGDRFDLLSAPAVLTSFEKLPGSMLRLERRRTENAEVVYQVVLERAGTFSANFSYEFALAENARGFPILTGAAAADVATVHVPRAEVQISAKGAATVNLSVFGESSQLAQIVFKPKAAREVKWNPRERDRSEETPRILASGENLYVPAPGLIEGFHVLSFVPAQGEISRVRINIPKPFSVSRIEGAAIHRWNFNRDTGLLTVLFTAPRVSAFSLSIFTQAQLSVLPVSQKFSALETLDAVAQVRTIGVATGEGVQVDSVSAEGLSAIDEEEYVAALDAAGMKIADGLRLRRAFKSVGDNSEFSAELSGVRPDLRIEAREAFYVNNDSLRAKIDFSATVSRAEIFRMAFRLPEGMDVDAIRGDELSYWTKDVAADGLATVTMHLKKALEGKCDFEVLLSGAFPRNQKEWTLPEFSIESAKIQRGEIRVHVEEGLRLKPIYAGVMMLAGTESDGENDTFGFRYLNRRTESPKFIVLESRPFTTVSWLHRVDAYGRFARSRVDMIFEIENVMRSGVRVRIPENACAVRFSGEEIVSAEKVAGTPDLWELKFSKPLRGKVNAAVEFFSELPMATAANVVPVSVEDADRQSAWLAVKRDEVFTDLRSPSPEKVSEKDVPAELREALSGGEWFVEKYAEKYAAELTLAPAAVAAWRACRTDEHSDSFSAETLVRTTVFSSESAVTEDRFLLSVARSDLLRVKLPEGGALKSISLDGRAVPFVADAAAGVFLPVFARAGKPVSVSVVYEHPVNAARRGELKVLEIVPAEILSAGKITWRLRSRDGGSAVALDIFGRNPDLLRVAPESDGGLLDAYFGENVPAEKSGREFSADAVPAESDSRIAFSIAGTELLKSSAVVAFCSDNKTGDDSDMGIFVALFAALLVFKGVRILRLRKNAKK